MIHLYYLIKLLSVTLHQLWHATVTGDTQELIQSDSSLPDTNAKKLWLTFLPSEALTCYKRVIKLKNLEFFFHLPCFLSSQQANPGNPETATIRPYPIMPTKSRRNGSHYGSNINDRDLRKRGEFEPRWRRQVTVSKSCRFQCFQRTCLNTLQDLWQ